MTQADHAKLLADLGALLKAGEGMSRAVGFSGVLVAVDATEAGDLLARIQAALAHLGSVKRIPVELGNPALADPDECPIGMRVVATIHGPTELGRALPGAAVIEIPSPRKQ